MKINELRVMEPFSGLFPIDGKIMSAIAVNMEEVGYDGSQPIITWNGIVIDGHTRLAAAKQVGIEDVLVYEYEFEDEDEAIEYAIHNQRNRRNLTDVDIVRLVEQLDKRKQRGGDRKSEEVKSKASSEAIDIPVADKSSKTTASLIGTSRTKVEKVRAVMTQAPEPVKEAVKSGAITVNKAYEETKEYRAATEPKNKPVFNETNENIEWAKWSWNPVTGCKTGCKYCYARDIAMRFYGSFEPKFWPDRLAAPGNTKNKFVNDDGGRNVFLCSMADLWGPWVEKEWIDKVLGVIAEHPEWQFLALTKWPKRYLEFTLPNNLWCGATTDTAERMDEAVETFNEIDKNITFISSEPMMEEIRIPAGAKIDWVIIGGRSKSTGMPEGQPEWDWVVKLVDDARKIGAKVYLKPNLKPLKEYPINDKK